MSKMESYGMSWDHIGKPSDSQYAKWLSVMQSESVAESALRQTIEMMTKEHICGE